jgi:hypothetical protein
MVVQWVCQWEWECQWQVVIHLICNLLNLVCYHLVILVRLPLLVLLVLLLVVIMSNLVSHLPHLVTDKIHFSHKHFFFMFLVR